MIRVGITGGIGSGKTTVCRIFETLGIPVFYSDLRAKHLTDSDPQVVAGIKKEFGEHVYDQSGKLNRTKLAEIVFDNRDALERLNALIHPAVRNNFEDWAYENKDYPYLINEAALLVETGSYKSLDKLITVTAPLPLRVKRVTERDSVSEKSVLQRMENQLPEERKIEVSDFVIINDEKRLIIPQVMSIHEELKIFHK